MHVKWFVFRGCMQWNVRNPYYDFNLLTRTTADGGPFFNIWLPLWHFISNLDDVMWSVLLSRIIVVVIVFATFFSCRILQKSERRLLYARHGSCQIKNVCMLIPVYMCVRGACIPGKQSHIYTWIIYDRLHACSTGDHVRIVLYISIREKHSRIEWHTTTEKQS